MISYNVLCPHPHKEVMGVGGLHRVTNTSESVSDLLLLIQSSKRSMQSSWWGCHFQFDLHSLFSNLLIHTAISPSFSPSNLVWLISLSLSGSSAVTLLLVMAFSLEPYSFIGFDLWLLNIDRTLAIQNLIRWLLHVSFLFAQPYYPFVQVKRCLSILWSSAFLIYSEFLCEILNIY